MDSLSVLDIRAGGDGHDVAHAHAQVIANHLVHPDFLVRAVIIAQNDAHLAVSTRSDIVRTVSRFRRPLRSTVSPRKRSSSSIFALTLQTVVASTTGTRKLGARAHLAQGHHGVVIVHSIFNHQAVGFDLLRRLLWLLSVPVSTRFDEIAKVL
jgi:hypothetical protein